MFTSCGYLPPHPAAWRLRPLEARPRPRAATAPCFARLTRNDWYEKIRIVEQSPDWTIEYYVEDSGRAPAREFLLGLDGRTFARFQASLEQLRVRNVHARYPLVRHVEDKLWELREESQRNIFRVLYFFYTGRRIVLLHGFAKKTQRLQRNDIEIALRRLRRFEEREGGE